MQTKCLRLMGKKLLVLTLKGKFAAEGLHDIEEDDDMLAAMARELVEKDGIGETADAVWSQLKQVYDQLPIACETMPPVDDEGRGSEKLVFEDLEAAVIDELPASDEPRAAVPVPVPDAMTVPTLFGQTFSSTKPRGKRPRELDPLQGSLFTWH